MGTKGKITEQCCLLALFGGGLLSSTTLEQLTRGGTTPSELGLSTSIVNKENTLQICL